MKQKFTTCIVTALLLVLSGRGFPGHGLRFASPADDSDRGWEQQSLPIGCEGCCRTEGDEMNLNLTQLVLTSSCVKI